MDHNIYDLCDKINIIKYDYLFIMHNYFIMLFLCKDIMQQFPSMYPIKTQKIGEDSKTYMVERTSYGEKFWKHVSFTKLIVRYIGHIKQDENITLPKGWTMDNNNDVLIFHGPTNEYGLAIDAIYAKFNKYKEDGKISSYNVRLKHNLTE
jgi:hypothetical protein